MCLSNREQPTETGLTEASPFVSRSYARLFLQCVQPPGSHLDSDPCPCPCHSSFVPLLSSCMFSSPDLDNVNYDFKPVRFRAHTLTASCARSQDAPLHARALFQTLFACLRSQGCPQA